MTAGWVGIGSAAATMHQGPRQPIESCAVLFLFGLPLLPYCPNLGLVHCILDPARFWPKTSFPSARSHRRPLLSCAWSLSPRLELGGHRRQGRQALACPHRWVRRVGSQSMRPKEPVLQKGERLGIEEKTGLFFTFC